MELYLSVTHGCRLSPCFELQPLTGNFLFSFHRCVELSFGYVTIASVTSVVSDREPEKANSDLLCMSIVPLVAHHSSKESLITNPTSHCQMGHWNCSIISLTMNALLHLVFLLLALLPFSTAQDSVTSAIEQLPTCAVCRAATKNRAAVY